MNNDFKELKHENISKLLDQIGPFLNDSSYTDLLVAENESVKVLARQKVVLRTNCVDSIDRTNYAQSVFARSILKLQLAALNLDKIPEQLTLNVPLPLSLEESFKKYWVTNGDLLAKMYTGTASLQISELILLILCIYRKGRRTREGVKEDIRTELRRYFKSTYASGLAQASIDAMIHPDHQHSQLGWTYKGYAFVFVMTIAYFLVCAWLLTILSTKASQAALTSLEMRIDKDLLFVFFSPVAFYIYPKLLKSKNITLESLIDCSIRTSVQEKDP